MLSMLRHSSCRLGKTALLARSLSTLPYHIVVGMPALSPTMTSGTLAEWYVQVGQSFAAGDALAKIETDKASIDFEAQDDGHVAKILQQPGVDLNVGTPILITVEEEEHVGAFANYEYKEESKPADSKPADSKPAETMAAAPKEKPDPPAPPKQEAAPKAAAPAPKPAAAPAPPAPKPAVAPAPPTPSFGSPAVKWGQLAAQKSPLKATLAKQQKAYIEKYGTTGQMPL
jgi:pyruvate dehydrogenase E2 component (dihydrolipoamide acetyltransferase)